MLVCRSVISAADEDSLNYLELVSQQNSSLWMRVIKNPQDILNSNSDSETLVICPGHEFTVSGFTFDNVPETVTFLMEKPSSEERIRGLRLDSKVFLFQNVNDSHWSVEERYRILGGPVTTNSIGTWHPDSGFSVYNDKSVWERRSDLGGIVLRDPALQWSPFTIVRDDGTVEGEGEQFKQCECFSF